jgi:uncharacterized protein with WD repeat
VQNTTWLLKLFFNKDNAISNHQITLSTAKRNGDIEKQRQQTFFIRFESNVVKVKSKTGTQAIGYDGASSDSPPCPFESFRCNDKITRKFVVESLKIYH